MAAAQILVVEDEGIVAEDIQSMLEGMGYAVPAIAISGEEAVQKTAENQPDLVLMDIMLKGDIDGIEAAEQIRSHSHIPLIYLTAYGDGDTLQRAKITEPYGYILKPFQERELHTVIEIALYKHEMEKKLGESEEKYRSIFEAAASLIVSIDEHGTILDCNGRIQQLLNYTQDEVVGRYMSWIIHPDYLTEAEQALGNVLAEGTIREEQLKMVEKNGAIIDISISFSPLRDENGNCIRAVCMVEDITEKRRTAAELRKIQRLESIGTLAGGIAHDFNNILTAIMGNISLAKTYTDPDNISTRLDAAQKATTRAKELTQQLLTFSTNHTPFKRAVSVVKLLRDSASFSLRGSNVKCELAMPDDLWTVRIDEERMSQAISNLIVNADQAMPDGGIVRVSAKNIVLEPENALSLRAGKYVEISVEDTGMGIPGQHLRNIFDPYFTTRDKASGLGLAIAYSIVREHNGRITVESGLEFGTNLYVYIPASPEESLEEKETPEEEFTMGAGKVLIMDADEQIRDLTHEMLNNTGYEVTVAEEGAEMIELYRQAKESGCPFDVVMMDLTVPGGMGGEEAIRKIMKIDPEIRAIISSGYSDNLVMVNFQQFGFRAAITKPYSVEQLSMVLHRVMKMQTP